MDLLSFDKDSIIFGDKPNASVLEYNDKHGFTPEILSTKKKMLLEFIKIQKLMIKKN